MSTKNPDLITLSVEGLVTDLAKKINNIFAYYLRSFYSQSTVYLGRVESLSHDVQLYGNKPNEMTSAVKNALENLYGEYFENVNIDVNFRENDINSPDYTIVISGTISDGESVFNLNKSLDFDNGVLQEINEENENGQ